MKKPDEIPTVKVEEHLKIMVTEQNTTGNIVAETTKIVMCQRVK